MCNIVAISTASVTAINRNIYCEIKRRGWKIELVIPQDYPVTPSRKISGEPARPQDPAIHYLKLKGTNPRTFYFPELESVLSQSNPVIVILESDPVSRLAVQAGKYCKRNEAYLLCLSCENLPFDILPNLKRRGVVSIPSSLVKKYLYLAAKNKIDTVFTINNDGTQLFKEKGYHNVAKIPLGFDPLVFHEDAQIRNDLRKRLNLTFPVIAYFGRMVEQKGVHFLVEALSRLKHLKWHFMLDKFDLYANSYNLYIDRLIAEMKLTERVTYIEAGHNEIAGYMNAADVVVLPSISTAKWKEQYGRVAPEAMACGKLVVAAKSGALPELIGNGGVLFEEGDSAQLTIILEDYLNFPTRYDKIRKSALARAEELSLEKQADVYVNRIVEILGNQKNLPGGNV